MKLGMFNQNKFLRYATIALLIIVFATLTFVAVINNEVYALGGTNVYNVYTEDGGWSRTDLDNLAKKLGYSTGFNAMVEAAKNASNPKRAYELFNTSDTNSDASKEARVIIGGYSFTPVYLSKDTSGNAILTLWSDESVDNGNGSRTFSYNMVRSATDPKSNAYDNSYLRTIILNNDGYYYGSLEKDENDEYLFPGLHFTPVSDHFLSLFTHGAVSKYIVSPKDMAWQTAEANALNDISYNAAVEGYGNNWQNDKLWLPSYAEIATIWQTTLNQRRNDSSYWTRTAMDETSLSYSGRDYVTYINYLGNSSNQSVVTEERSLRFALNLNISHISYLLREIKGYEKTKTDNDTFFALQQAWIEAIDHSGDRSYGDKYTEANPKAFRNLSGDVVAYVYWSNDYEKHSVNPKTVYKLNTANNETVQNKKSETIWLSSSGGTDNKGKTASAAAGSIVFKLNADWGAKLKLITSNYSSLITTNYTNQGDAAPHDDNFYTEVCDIRGFASADTNAAYPSFGGGVYSTESAPYRHKPSNGPVNATIRRGNGSTLSGVNLNGVYPTEGYTNGNNKYFMGGSLYVHPGCMVTVDLNGHTINRNIYDPQLVNDTSTNTIDTNALVPGAYGNYFAAFGYTDISKVSHHITLNITIGDQNCSVYTDSIGYGCVFYVFRGDLTVDDTSEDAKFANYTKDGLVNIGRITGGVATGNATSPFKADYGGSASFGAWAGGPNYGAAIRVYGITTEGDVLSYGDTVKTARSSEFKTDPDQEAYMQLINGAVCFNISDSFGAINTAFCQFEMTGGFINNNRSLGTSSQAGGAIGQNDTPSDLRLSNGVISYNDAPTESSTGGALYVDGDNSNKGADLVLTFENMKFEYNKAQSGGVVCGEYLTAQRKSMGFNNCYVVGNFANYGGCVAPVSSSGYSGATWGWDIDIYGGYWANNSAAIAGGIAYVNTFADVKMDGTTKYGKLVLKNNKAYGETITIDPDTEEEEVVPQGLGGIVYNRQGDIYITGVEIDTCEARLDGGALYLLSDLSTDKNAIEKGRIVIKDSTITNAKAGRNGGAIYQNNGNIILQGNSLIDNCEAIYDGGGIYINTGNFIMYSGRVTNCQTKTAHTENAEEVYGGGGLYLNNGDFVMYSGAFNNNTSAGTGGGVYMKKIEYPANTAEKDKNGMYLIQNKEEGYGPIEFKNNQAAYYPGFYATNLYMQGEIYVQDNKKNGLDRNVYLSTEDSVIYATGALSGYIGITKTIPEGQDTIDVVYSSSLDVGVSEESYIQNTQGSSNVVLTNTAYHKNKIRYLIGKGNYSSGKYKMKPSDLLCFHSDVKAEGTKTYTFTVSKSDNALTYNDLIYFSATYDDSGDSLHTHTYASNYTINPTCTEQGYTVSVCTGCQELAEKENIPLGEDAFDVDYISPTGHMYSNGVEITPGIVEFTCNNCGEKLYAEVDELPDKEYTGNRILPTTIARVYQLDEEGNKLYWDDATADWDYEYITYFTSVNSIEQPGSNCIAGGEAVVKVRINAGLDLRGKYTIPFGTFQGQEAQHAPWIREDLISPVGFTRTFNILKVTPDITVKAPVGTYYTTQEDTDKFFEDIYTLVSINNGSTVLDDTYGTFKYYKDEDMLTEVSILEPGEYTYYYKWIPKDSRLVDSDIARDYTRSLNEVTGSFSYGALDYELLSVTIQSVSSSNFIDENGWGPVKNAMTVIARFKVSEDGEEREIELSPNDYNAVIVDPTTSAEYEQLRAGNYYIKAYYTYPKDSTEPNHTKSYRTISTYTFISVTEIIGINAYYKNVKVSDSDPDTSTTQVIPVYDYETLEDLRNHVIVYGQYHDLEDGVQVTKTRQISASHIICSDWGQGGERYYTVKFMYNTNDSTNEDKTSELEFYVTTNKVERIDIDWNQTSTPTILVEDVTKVGDYGDLVVTAVYTNGEEKELELNKPAKNGYKVTGSFANVGQTQLTFTYSEANKVTNIVTTVTNRINVVVSDLQVSNLEYEMKEGKVFAYEGDNNQAKVAAKINVYSTLLGSNERILTPVQDTVNEESLYYKVHIVYYEDVSVEESESGKILYIQFRVYSSKTNNLLYQMEDRAQVPKRKVVDIEVVSKYKDVVGEDIREGIISINGFKDEYLQIKEIYDDSTEAILEAGNDYIKNYVRITNPSVFSAGSNSLTIEYTTPTSEIIYKTLVVDVIARTKLVSLVIEYKQASYDANNDGKLDENYIFTSSNIDNIKALINVKGFFSDGSTDYYNVSEYELTGQFVAGEKTFTVTVVDVDGSKTVDFVVNVTAVAIDTIEATINQGEVILYETSNISLLYDKVTIKGINNDGSEVNVTSGYSLSIKSNSGKFKVGTNNVIEVEYLGKTCEAEGTVEVSKATLDSITITSAQGSTILYQSSPLTLVNNCIVVKANYIDGTTKTLNSTQYTLEGNESERYKDETVKVYDSYTVTYTEDDITCTADVLSPRDLTLTPLAVTSIVSVTCTIKTSETDTGDNKHVFYKSYGLDKVKDHLTIVALYNDGIQRNLIDSEYTLAVKNASEITAGAVNTITLTHGALTPNEFNIYCERYAIRNIVSITTTQRTTGANIDYIYTDTTLEALKDFAVVTVSQYDPGNPDALTNINLNVAETKVLTADQYTIQGTINKNGSYDLEFRANGVTYDIRIRPYAIHNTDATPVYVITPIVPDHLVVNREALDAEGVKVYTGATFAQLSNYFEVKVVYNNGDEKDISYDSTGSNGYTLSTANGLLISYDGVNPNGVTMTYREDGSSPITQSLIVNIYANEIKGMEATYTQNPLDNSSIIYSSNIFGANNAVNYTALSSKIRPYIVAKEVWTDERRETTSDYDIKQSAGIKYEDGQDANYVIANGGNIIVTLALELNTDFTCEITVYVTKVVETELEITQDATKKIYSSYTVENNLTDIKNAIITKKVFNDGTKETVLVSDSNYEITITGIIALDSKVTINATYTIITYDEHSNPISTKTLTGSKEVDITSVIPTDLRVTFDSVTCGTIFTSTSKEKIQNNLTVEAKYNDSDDYIELTKYDYTLTYRNKANNEVITELIAGDVILEVSHTYNGTNITDNTVEIEVQSIDVGSIVITPKADFIEDGVQKKTIFNSEGINTIRQYITVTAYGNDQDETELGEVDTYTLTLKTGTWGVGTKTIVATYKTKTDEIDIEITQYQLSSSEAILDKSGLTIYSDYVFNDIKDTLQSKIAIQGTWDDAYDHSSSYTQEILLLTGTNGADKFTVTYYYYDNSNPVKTEYSTEISIADILIATEISSIEIKEIEDDYTIYTSDNVSKAEEGLELYLVYNSGNKTKVEFSSYPTHSFTANSTAWAAGGSVEVTAYVYINSVQYSNKANITITPVELEDIEVTYTQKTGDDGIVYQSNTSRDKILVAGVVAITGTNNDNSTISIQATKDMLSFDFSTATENLEGQLIGEVTLTYLTYVKTFNVVLTKVEITSISVALVNSTIKIYTNSNISALANKIVVTANYNDSSTQNISYIGDGSEGYTIWQYGDGNVEEAASIEIEGSDPVTKVVFVKYGDEKSNDLQITIEPRKLVEIQAVYTQDTNSKLFKISTIEDIVSLPHVLIVNAKYKLDEEGSITVEESVTKGNYTVTYSGGEFPDGGEITLTVSYTYGKNDDMSDNTKTATFKVNLTKKAQTGIEASYTLDENQKVFSSTLARELVEDTTYYRYFNAAGKLISASTDANIESSLTEIYYLGDKEYYRYFTKSGDVVTLLVNPSDVDATRTETIVLSKKGSLALTAKYNDGTSALLGSATYSSKAETGKYTLSANFENSNVVTVTYEGFTTTFNITDVKTPKLESMNVSQKADTKLYTSDNLTGIKNKFVVEALYNDEHTAGVVLTIAQYELTYEQYVGVKPLTFTLASSLAPAGETISKEIDGTFVQKVSLADLSLEYSTTTGSNKQYTKVTTAGIRESVNNSGDDTGYFIRYSFEANDESKSLINMRFSIYNSTPNSDPLERMENDVDLYSFIVKDGLKRETFTIKGLSVDVPTSNLEYYELVFVGTETSLDTQFDIFVVEQVTMSFTYEKAVGQTIYTTTTLEELIVDTTYKGNSIAAKGNAKINVVYNDGSNGDLEETRFPQTVEGQQVYDEKRIEVVKDPTNSSRITVNVTFYKDNEETAYHYTYTLSGNLMTSNVLTLEYDGGQASFNLTGIVVPDVEIEFEVADVKYGAILADIKTNFGDIKTAVYQDDHGDSALANISATTKNTIVNSNSYTFYSDSEMLTSVDLDKVFTKVYIGIDATASDVNNNSTRYYGNGVANVVNADITNVVVSGYNGSYTGNPVAFVDDANKSANIVNNETATWLYRIKVPEGEAENSYAASVSIVDVGTYTVEYKISASKHNDKFGEFTVEVKSISIVYATIANIADRVYNGTAYTPELTLTFNGATLTKDVDYTVEYSQNVKAKSDTNNPNVKITGIGNFDDNVTKSFNITNATLTGISITGYTGTYDTQAHSVFVANTNLATNVTSSVDGVDNNIYWTFSIDEGSEKTYTSTLDIINAKTYTVYYKVNAESHNEVSGQFTATISKRDINDVSILYYTGNVVDPTETASTPNSYTYTGSAFTPELKVTYSNDTLLKDTNYTIAYSNNVNVGNATCSITAKEDSNYTGTKANIPLCTITNAEIEVTVTPYEAVYDGDEHEVQASVTQTVVNEQVATWTYSLDQNDDNSYVQSLKKKDVGEYTVYYKCEVPNHETKTGSFVAKITNATITSIAVTPYGNDTDNKVQYDGEAHAPITSATATTVDNCEYTYTYSYTENRTYVSLDDLDTIKNAGQVTVYYKVNAANHAEATGSVDVHIQKRELKVTVLDSTILVKYPKPASFKYNVVAIIDGDEYQGIVDYKEVEDKQVLLTLVELFPDFVIDAPTYTGSALTSNDEAQYPLTCTYTNNNSNYTIKTLVNNANLNTVAVSFVLKDESKCYFAVENNGKLDKADSYDPSNTMYLAGLSDNLTLEIVYSQFVASDGFTAVDINSKVLTSTSIVGTGTVISLGDLSLILIQYGDTNGDGKINAKDSNAVKKHILGTTLEGIAALAADTNNDGKINAKDSNAVKKHILGTSLYAEVIENLNTPSLGIKEVIVVEEKFEEQVTNSASIAKEIILEEIILNEVVEEEQNEEIVEEEVIEIEQETIEVIEESQESETIPNDELPIEQKNDIVDIYCEDKDKLVLIKKEIMSVEEKGEYAYAI